MSVSGGRRSVSSRKLSFFWNAYQQGWHETKSGSCNWLKRVDNDKPKVVNGINEIGVKHVDFVIAGGGGDCVLVVFRWRCDSFIFGDNGISHEGQEK